MLHVLPVVGQARSPQETAWSLVKPGYSVSYSEYIWCTLNHPLVVVPQKPELVWRVRCVSQDIQGFRIQPSSGVYRRA